MPGQNIHIIGVDSGGTFTDFVYYNGKTLRSCKVLSTPQSPELAIVKGLEQLNAPLDQCTIVHGSTVATNAVLEGKGARTAFITNRGFADMLTIGRQTRSELYALEPKSPPVPVAPELCFEIDVRIDSHGAIITNLDQAKLSTLKQQVNDAQVESVAINLLFSFVDSRHEQLIANMLPDNIFVSCSSTVLAEYKEYERGISTWLNAFVGPVIKRYLTRLSEHLPTSKISIMQSTGGTAAIDHCADHGAKLLLSGPAGGLAAARHIAKQCGVTQLLSLDMGGTSTDVALIDHDLQLTTEGRIGDYPVAIAMVDIHTIGAGGGSIAWIDDGGLLQVGPQSAGATPGPACYGNNSQLATITDANLILGKLPRSTKLAGELSLDYSAAQSAISTLAAKLRLSITETASGVIAIAEENMANALRRISIQRGHDTRHFTLSSFGGAGGLHVCAIADMLGIQHAIIPRYAGVLSAFGMLVAPRKQLLSRTLIGTGITTDGDINTAFQNLSDQATLDLVAQELDVHDISHQLSVDMRYQGQSFTLNVPWHSLLQSVLLFEEKHLQRYGHKLDHQVELVTIRLSASGPEPLINVMPSGINVPAATPATGEGNTPIYQRHDIGPDAIVTGPAIICEEITTSYIAENWQAQIDQYHNLRLEQLTVN